MDVSHLVGERISAVRAVGAEPTATRNLPWLEFELQSGRKLELAPITPVVNRIEELRIDLREVESFRNVQRWPNGPDVPKSNLQALSFALSKPIASATVNWDGSAEAITMQLWGGGAVHIRHDFALPMSLAVGEA